VVKNIGTKLREVSGKEKISKYVKSEHKAKNPEMKVIALGMGVQSICLYMMSSTGYLERADHAIFSDPGAEHPDTYEYIKYLQEWKKYNNGIPIHIVSKNLYKDLLNGTNSRGVKWASIPAFSESKGMVLRQCTGEYKIRPVIEKVRKLYGLKKGKRMPITEMWLGITIDEAQRMNSSPHKRIVNRFPFLEMMMNRNDCKSFFKKRNHPIPIKSSCIFCPYHSDSQWIDLKKNHPDLFKNAVKCDEAIRNSSKRGSKDKLYLHKSLIPLKDVEFNGENQVDMFDNECEGHCGL